MKPFTTEHLQKEGDVLVARSKPLLPLDDKKGGFYREIIYRQYRFLSVEAIGDLTQYMVCFHLRFHNEPMYVLVDRDNVVRDDFVNAMYLTGYPIGHRQSIRMVRMANKDDIDKLFERFRIKDTAELEQDTV